MHYLASPIYRAVALIKAKLIAAASWEDAVQYLRLRGFSEVEAKNHLRLPQ